MQRGFVQMPYCGSLVRQSSAPGEKASVACLLPPVSVFRAVYSAAAIQPSGQFHFFGLLLFPTSHPLGHSERWSACFEAWLKPVAARGAVQDGRTAPRDANVLEIFPNHSNCPL